MQLKKENLALLIVLLLLCAPTYSMEFRWGAISGATTGAKRNEKEVIYMSGPIEPGDYDRFTRFLAKDFDAYVKSTHLVYISSPGGDGLEGMKIARLVKEMYADVGVLAGESCASACFFVYVSAVQRSMLGGRVGIHRPYFSPQHFEKLSPVEAERRQLELTKTVNSFLVENYVPSFLIDRMNATASNKISWLTDNEIYDLGEYSNWFEELLLGNAVTLPT